MNSKNIYLSGLVKVCSLINNRVTQSDTRISCIVFHKISEIYRGMKHQENLQELIEIQNLKSTKYI